MVSVYLIDHAEPVRLEDAEAAALLVKQYGKRAVDVEISGLRSACEATWAEVDRLLDS